MSILPPSPFLSAASLQPVAEAAASSPLSSLSEAAVINSVSGDDGNRSLPRENPARAGESEPSVMLACAPSGTAAALSRTSVLDAQTDAAAGLSDSKDVPAQMQESKARHSGLACDDKKPGDTMQESRPARPATALSDDDLYWQLRFADDPFTRDLPDIPNPHAFFNKIIEVDVWADPLPMFLQRTA